VNTIVKAAAVQISPVLYSRRGTVEKIVKKMRELGKQDVQFATFPEAVVSEGAYEQSEMIIQALLAEASIGSVDREPVSVDGRGLEAAADWRSLKSPENYVGYDRTQNFASPGGAVLDKPRVYMLPARLRLNE
jgi:hypothetical protein